MSKRKCVVCGKDPAEGFASINDEFYCHGDDHLEATCYMLAIWNELVAKHPGVFDDMLTSKP